MERQMNPHLIQDAWEQAKLLLVVGGNEWPKAFDALDIARLSMEPPLRADALVNKLRDVPASGGWCCRDSNIAGHYRADTGGIDGPASFPVWKRGNDQHYLLVANGRKEQMIARRMHTADDMREFYLAREQEPPGLLAAWIAGKSELTAPKEAPAAPLATDPQLREKQTRHDDIAVELDDILSAMHKDGARITPATVMPILKKRAGTIASCITDAFDYGVIWNRGNPDQTEKLTMESLKGRILRWKEKNANGSPTTR
jgi:hypothetical protein